MNESLLLTITPSTDKEKYLTLKKRFFYISYHKTQHCILVTMRLILCCIPLTANFKCTLQICECPGQWRTLVEYGWVTQYGKKTTTSKPCAYSMEWTMGFNTVEYNYLPLPWIPASGAKFPIYSMLSLHSWGFLNLRSLISSFVNRQNILLDSLKHIWRVLLQLRCGNTCQIWTWYSIAKLRFGDTVDFGE